jgi:lipopolysaccharide/colanic/teichoic acid biosynthesis glycosyltransferase
MQLYSNIIKPLLDSLIALIALLLLSPLFIFLTIFLYVANEGKPFFFQSRPGRNGHIFRVIKFKTMNDKRGSDGQLLPDEARLTPVGKFVRKTSLDEIPQLLNVLKGDMSLVGPRPLLVEYLPLYNEEQRKRHDVRPGITGWAQVNGRNAISWHAKFAYDVWYVDNISFLLDLKILWMTVLKVIQSEGVSSASSVTMEKFTGNDAH